MEPQNWRPRLDDHRAKLSRLVVCLFFCSSTCLAQVATKPAEKHNDKDLETSYEVNAAIARGDNDQARRDLGAASNDYGKAVNLSRPLPDRYCLLKAEALQKLADVLNAEKKSEQAEVLLKERVTVLEQVPETAGLQLGLALFDLESQYGGTQQVDKAADTAVRAVGFYQKCIATGDESGRVCDRRLADVQGLMGCVFFLAGRFSESEPWLQSVIARDDDQVRPEVMLVSLQAYTKLMFQNGKILESARIAHRAEEFRRKHPEAARAAGETP